jgi:hypothetical protein
MIRIKADGELLDIPTDFTFTAMNMARAVRPSTVVVSDTRAGRYELADDADATLYTGDKVAHWSQPGLTGEIVETEVPRSGPRHHWVEWPSGRDSVAYFPHSLIRVTRLES